jgi:hypothetical protein
MQNDRLAARHKTGEFDGRGRIWPASTRIRPTAPIPGISTSSNDYIIKFLLKAPQKLLKA